MKISIFTHIYPAPDGLGIEADTKVVHYFALERKKAGDDVQVYHLWHEPVKRIHKGGAKLILPKKTDHEVDGIPVRLIRYGLVVPKRRFPQSFQLRAIDRFVSERERERGGNVDASFVHFPTFFRGVRSTTNARKSIATFHISDVFNLGLNSGETTRHDLERYDLWGARNEAIRKELLDRFGHDSVLVRTGIESEFIANEETVLSKASRGMNPMRIVFVGKLIRRKFADVAIEAARKSGFPFELEIVGDGPERERLERLADGDERIRFFGNVPRDEVRRRMSEADVFAMTSEKETYGLVYLEAMGQGCLCVGTKGEGIDGIMVDGENGFLTRAGDSEALAEVLKRISKLNVEERKRLLTAGLETARNMEASKVAAEYASLVAPVD